MNSINRQDGVPQLPAPANRRRAQRWRNSTRDTADLAYAASLQAELASLREENDRLRMGLSQSGVDDVADQLLALSGQRSIDQLDHVTRQALSMHDLLSDICKDLGQSVIALHTRLSELHVDLPPHDGPDAHASDETKRTGAE